MKTILILIMMLNVYSLTLNGQFSNLKSKAKELSSNAIPMLNNQNPDQGYTSKTHEKYAGKIVFAENLQSISFKNENPSAFKSSFQVSEPIYARVYLHKSIGNTAHEGDRTHKANIMYDLYIDGKKVSFKKAFGMYRHIPDNERTFYMEDIENNDQLNQWTTWRPTLLPLEKDDDLKYGSVNIMARSFALSLLDLSAGTHEVELRMYSRDLASGAETEVLASGSFSLKITEADKKTLAFKYVPPLPKDTWIGGDKEAITSEIEKAFIDELRKTPIATGIYSKDWNEGTYSLTGQRYRKIAGWAVFDDTDGDGQVPITTFNFISDYSGGSWIKLRFDSHCLGCPDWDVEVEAVKAFVRNN